MDNDTTADSEPGPQPLEPGWWKTSAGWTAARESGLTDPRVKPLVIFGMVVVFLGAAWITDWKEVWAISILASATILLVLIARPPRSMDPSQPLVEKGWWRTLRGWKSMLSAHPDDPARRYVPLFHVLLVAAGAFLFVGVGFWWVAVMAAVASLLTVLPRETSDPIAWIGIGLALLFMFATAAGSS